VSLLESVEATEVGDARVGGLDLVGDTEDGCDLDERGRDDLTVEDGLAEVADCLGAQETPAGGGRGGRGRRPGSLAVTRGILVSFFSSAYLYA